jgi:hypothetical protein
MVLKPRANRKADAGFLTGPLWPEFAEMKRVIPLVASAIMALALPHPALAEGPSSDKVNQLIVFGNDPCPPSTDDQITVCARKDEGERFRIPEPLRENPNKASNQAWTERVKAYETVGAFGTNSCSPVGGGGDTGCLARLISSAHAERKQSSDVHFAKLIQAEREKRLETVDSDAAAEQARVESLEKEYDARLARERTAGDTPVPPTQTPGSLATPPADTEPTGHQ